MKNYKIFVKFLYLFMLISRDNSNVKHYPMKDKIIDLEFSNFL